MNIHAAAVRATPNVVIYSAILRARFPPGEEIAGQPSPPGCHCASAFPGPVWPRPVTTLRLSRLPMPSVAVRAAPARGGCYWPTRPCVNTWGTTWPWRRPRPGQARARHEPGAPDELPAGTCLRHSSAGRRCHLMGFWGTFIVARCDHELMDLDPVKASAAAFRGCRAKTPLVRLTDRR